MSGCMTQLSSQNQRFISFHVRQKQLNHIQNWQIKGAISGQIATPLSTHKKQSFNVYVTWHQQDNAYQINIFGFLGIGMTTLKGNQTSVTLTHAKQQITANNPQKLLAETIGLPIPIQNLYYWIRSMPVPNIDSHLTLDRYNHMLHLEQLGFHIDYQQYVRIKQHDLPKKMIIRYRNITLRLVITHWQIDP